MKPDSNAWFDPYGAYSESYIEATKDAVDSYLVRMDDRLARQLVIMGVIRICMDNSVIVITGCI